MVITSDAITLRLIPYSETSLISRIYTKEHGKITLMAKGARRSKSSLSAILEPANLISATYFHKDSHNIQTIKEASFINNYSTMKSQLLTLNYGLSVVECLDKTNYESNPIPILFRLVKRVLEKLDNHETNKDNIFGFFLYQFAVRQGFKPEISTCSHCRQPLGIIFTFWCYPFSHK